MRCESFPPVCGPDARVLILGTLPGPSSLEMQQYYAQPRNAFWPIMGALIGAGQDLPYAERLARLTARRIALWDVCARAFRVGALDSKIAPASIEANDFEGLFAQCPEIEHIFFNGATAENLYRRRVLPRQAVPAAPMTRLPSTSPAFAASPYAAKLARWREALGPFLEQAFGPGA